MHVDRNTPALAVLAPTTLVFDRASIQAVDREAIEQYGIPGIVLMENAAIGLADCVYRLLGDAGNGGRALICCGGGNNGGDGYAAARHLTNRGIDVLIHILGEPRDGSDAAVNASICQEMDVQQLRDIDQCPSNIDLIVDAIVGTGLTRPTDGAAASLIEWINKQQCPVLAVDVPSGLDCDSGEALGPTVKAHTTVTFVGIKQGFVQPIAAPWLGAITIIDIGAPIELYRKHGIPLGDFRERKGIQP